jgi:RHS repeat-associated protein
LGTPGIANTHLFAGERFNTDSGLYYNRARWMDPKAGRFLARDPHPGVKNRPATLHDYAYALNDPVDLVDPSGKFALISVSMPDGALRQAATGQGVRVLANHAAGKAFERFVGAQLERFAARNGGEVFKNVFIQGNGGRRFADFVVRVGDKLVVIETKTKVPLSGGALKRLGGQLLSYLNPSRVAVKGQVVETLVIVEQDVVAAEAAWAVIAPGLESGAIGPVLQGSVQLMNVLRNVLIGL